MKTDAAAVLIALAFAGCNDARETSDMAASPEAPVPGDPAFYAPDGWPPEIGDEITDVARRRLAKDFPSLGPWGHALHLVGDVVYAATHREAPGETHGFIYEGHFPASVAMRYKDREPTLPPRFHGKISYEPSRAPLPPHLATELSTDAEGRPIQPEGAARPPKDICRDKIVTPDHWVLAET